jgi:helix-turn-helix protein
MATDEKSSDKLRPYEWQHAISASNLDPVTRGVLWALSLYINKHTGYAFPSLRTLSRASGYSLDAVRHHIKIALSSGWITTDNAGLEGQEWRRGAYISAIPEGAPRRLETKRKYKGVLTGSTPSTQEDVLTGSIPSTQEGVLPQPQGVLPQPQNMPLEIAQEPAPVVACSDSPAAPNNILTIEEQDPPLPPKGGGVRGRTINDKRGTLMPELKAALNFSMRPTQESRGGKRRSRPGTSLIRMPAPQRRSYGRLKCKSSLSSGGVKTAALSPALQLG